MNRSYYNDIANGFAKHIEEWVRTSLFANFSMSVKLDWSYNRTCSRGGLYKKGPGINIAMIPALPNNNGSVPYRFYEYPSYDADKEIGGFYAYDPCLKLKAIVAHEAAHAIQMVSYRVTGSRCTPHGPVFKSYYKMLRTRFINQDIPSVQAVLKHDYDQYIRGLNNTGSK